MKVNLVLALVLGALALCGCRTSGQYGGAGAYSLPLYDQLAFTAPSGPAPSPASATVSSGRLLLYGGEHHNVFLGCLNSSEYDADSIWNKLGAYGSNLAANSIWNDLGVYGSNLSNYSPWNQFAQYPPVIVDDSGNFYGYFTKNKFHANRTTIPSLLALINVP